MTIIIDKTAITVKQLNLKRPRRPKQRSVGALISVRLLPHDRSAISSTTGEEVYCLALYYHDLYYPLSYDSRLKGDRTITFPSIVVMHTG